MKISDVLWKAANEYLSHDDDYYSCCAVSDAIWSYGTKMDYRARGDLDDRAMAFLRSLGVKTGGMNEFPKHMFPTFEARQGARYLWLMFAYEVAKDKGL